MRIVVDVRSLVDAEEAGEFVDSHWVKNVTQVTTAGVWFDLTGSAGNPRAKQWFDAAPLTAAAIYQSTDGGLYHGGAVSPQQKFLRFMRAQCVSAAPLPMELLLADYLLYYPTIEDGNTDPQVMDNTVTLPRYTDGAGVQMMAVTISARTGGQTFNVTYTNQDGVAGRVTPNHTQNAVAAPGTITTCATATSGSPPGPFMTLQEGDTGVRSVESVQMLGADTGFFALVLVRPLGNTMIRGIDAVYDKDFIIMANELSQVEDNAFLSLLCRPNGSLSAVAVRGTLKTVFV